MGDPESKAKFVLDQLSGILTQAMDASPETVIGVANKVAMDCRELELRDLDEAEWAILRSMALYGWAAYSLTHLEDEHEPHA